MFGLLFHLCCIEILVAQVTPGPRSGQGAPPTDNSHTSETLSHPSAFSSGMPEATYFTSQSPTTVTRLSTSHHHITSTGVTDAPNLLDMLLKKEGLVLMVTGGLIIACTMLLVSTLLLSCKVCQLSRRLKALGSNVDLISNTEYWTGTNKKNKGNSEEEPRATTMLMADLCQEEGTGATQVEGGAVNDEITKEAGGATNSEEASTIPGENSSSSKPQGETTDPQPVAAPTSAEEP